MDGRVTCNEEKCQQLLDTVQMNTETPTTTAAPSILNSVNSRSNSDRAEETGEKGAVGNVGSPG